MKNLFKNNLVKLILAPTLFLIGALFVLHLTNFIRLNTLTFRKSAQRLIEQSRQIRAQARPNYQSETLDDLPPNSINGDFFRFDDLLNKAVIGNEPSLPVKEDISGIVYGFEFDQNSSPGLRSRQGNATFQVNKGLLRIVHKSRDFLTNEIELRIPKDDIADIVIRARANKGSRMRFGWKREFKNIPENASVWHLWPNSIDINLIADDKFHTYVINAKNIFKWGVGYGGEIRRILLKPTNFDGAVVEIDYIRFISKLAKYSDRSHGSTYETIGKEMRHVMYMLPGYSLEYDLHIPKRSPTLDFGTGVLFENEPINFEVFIYDNGSPEILYSDVITHNDAWNDVRLNLSKWSGKQVRLSLRVSGSKKNVAFWSNPLLSSQPRKRFNVIIVLEDALRADHLSSYGHEWPTSPVKDKLFDKSGIVFLNAISQATKTKPSISSLMTSLLPTTHGVWHFSDMLSEEYLTMAEIMRSQGFVTASFIQNDHAGPYAGVHQGFSQLFDGEKVGRKTEDMFGENLANWLERHQHRNFLLYLHIVDPHGPYNPPSPYDRWYREASETQTPVPPSGFHLDPKWIKHPTIEGRRLLYDGEILHNDSLIPILLEQLSALNLYKNTILIFTADHGEYLGEHNGLWEHEPPGYLQVIGIPLMIMFPSKFGESKRISQTVQLIDVMPTILELAEIDPDRFLLQGDSLVELIEGRNLQYWENRISVSEEPTAMSKDNTKFSGSLFFQKWHLISSEKLFRFRGGNRLPLSLKMGVIDFRNDRTESMFAFSFLPDLYVKYNYLRIMKELQSTNMEARKKWTVGDQDEFYRLDPDVVKRLRSIGYLK